MKLSLVSHLDEPHAASSLAAVKHGLSAVVEPAASSVSSSFTIKTPQTSALLGQPSLTPPQKPVLSFSVHETPLSSHLCHGTGRAVLYVLSFLSRLPTHLCVAQTQGWEECAGGGQQAPSPSGSPCTSLCFIFLVCKMGRKVPVS